MKKIEMRLVVYVSLLLWSFGAVIFTTRAIEIPSPTVDTFIQTSGPNAPLRHGDYYTNVNGANGDHLIEIYVPCSFPPTLPITFALFDPESATPDPVGVIAFDETINAFDDTSYTLTAPDGNVIGPVTYTTDGTNGLWVELATLTHGTTGNGCGTYLLRAAVSDNDENAWRLRVNHDPDCSVTPGSCSTIGATASGLLDDGDELDDPDSVAGTGDEIQIGLTRTSFQQSAGNNVCQNFYFFVDGRTSPITLNNYDMDNNVSVNYYPPATSNYAPVQIGTLSSNVRWNNSQNGTRVGDSFAIDADDVGWWRADVCVNIRNQYIFEAIENEPVFFEQPPYPIMSIAKDDGETVVSFEGQVVTYTITYNNTGTGAAIDTVIQDTLPTGATFVACSDRCSQSGSTITWNLGVVPANTNGRVTVTVDLPPAPVGLTHTNNVTVDFTDFMGNVYPDPSDTDVDTVTSIPRPTPLPTVPGPNEPNPDPNPAIIVVDPFITKLADQSFAVPGEQVVWTIIVTNPGTIAAQNVRFTDTLPSAVRLIETSSTSGTVTVDGQTVTFSQASLAPGAQVTVIVRTQVKEDVSVPVLLNTACLQLAAGDERCAQARVALVQELPATGQSPWQLWRIVIGLGGIALLGVARSIARIIHKKDAS